MNKRTKILSIVTILQTFAIAALIFTIVRIRSAVRPLLENNLTNVVSESQPKETQEKIDLTANVSAHLVWWDQDRGSESIQNNSKYLNSISPFWYELNLKGNIEPFSGAGNKEIIAYLKKNNIKITPVITNEFEAEPLATIIVDSAKKSEHIQDIIEIAKNYDGISLNYENLNASDKDNYTAFVTDLAGELHKEGKTLAVHLHAKTSEPGTWNGPQAQDWEKLSQVCDGLKIMAYDYHWSTSEAGAIAPPDWVEDVVKHALTQIPKEKIYLGIPLYGYDWINEIGEGVTYGQAATLSNLNNATITFDDTTKSPHFSYSDNEENSHDVWFENAQSTKYKLELAKQYELGGIDFWRLGDEDPKVWDEVEDVFKSE